MGNTFLSFLSGFATTVLLFVATLVIAIPLGLIITFFSTSKAKVISAIAKFFISIIRGTPLMLQLIIIFYGPGLVFGPGVGIKSRIIASIVGFSINYACYFSEIYRGGIESISKGQYEAGEVLGMTKSQIFFKIVLLQVIKRILAPMSNEIITLVKDTSLSRIIALQEVIWAGQAFMKGTQGISGAIWPLFFTAVYYLIFSGILTVLLGKLEQKLDYFR